MKSSKSKARRQIGLVFLAIFVVCAITGAALASIHPATAAPAPLLAGQVPGYAGSETCASCHKTLHDTWLTTRHAQAFTSPIFQQDWSAKGSAVSCLACHTTGFDEVSGAYAQEGVTCEACHGPYQSDHPESPMPIKPDADLCSTCHKSTTDEWRVSLHAETGIQCQDCHNPHSQTPKAATVTELCTNCHKERGSSFTHGTHASAGLECSNCHMYTNPRTDDPIQGLIPTGHTFSVGSEACIGCHQDTVHSRDEIIKLTGQISETNVANVETLQQEVHEQAQTIQSLESQSTVRLYTGLAQGAIIGLITGGAAAWVISRRIKLVEEVLDNGKAKD